MMTFKPGDRVQMGYKLACTEANKHQTGTFEHYCRGYLSHAVVRLDEGGLKRVAVKRLTLEGNEQP
jgi:hypothetical protein